MTEARLTRRHRAERRFRLYGLLAVATALGFLVVLLANVAMRGYGAFTQTEIQLDIHFDSETVAAGNWSALVKQSLKARFPEVGKRRLRRKLNALVSSGAAFELAQRVSTEPALAGTTRAIWLPASDDVDMFFKGRIDTTAPMARRRLDDRQIAWLGALDDEGRIARHFNHRFFGNGDSREPELAGILGALVGSLLTMLVCLGLSFPLGVMTALYLEEFAPQNPWTDFIEININNLAAVPSIVFGLLGLGIFLNLFGLPRSAPLVGGMVLALMTLPTIIIASRAALRAVPPSLRQAALAMGASPLQTVLHQVLPLALPGIFTGTIIGLARALGDTAPLLMIGMVAFVVDVPRGLVDAATALPVQIFLWADSPERAFEERTAAAIIVLLGVMFLLNLTAVLLRRRFEIRW